MKRLNARGIGVIMLLAAAGGGCVYSDHYVVLSSSAVSVEGGVLNIPDARWQLERTIFYPIGFSFCFGYGHDGFDCLLGDLICHIPTFIPEIIFNNINDRQWVEDIRLPVFNADVSVSAGEFLVVGSIEGRQLEVETHNADGKGRASDGKCAIEFHLRPADQCAYNKVAMSGAINDGLGPRVVDFGMWNKDCKIFAGARKLYVVSNSLWHYTEWFLYRYHDTGANPVLWRVDPYTGEREVLVSFDTGKFIIENPPRKVESRYER